MIHSAPQPWIKPFEFVERTRYTAQLYATSRAASDLKVREGFPHPHRHRPCLDELSRNLRFSNV